MLGMVKIGESAMSIWNSRTKMEHAKTRSIVGDKKANGHDKEDEELDDIEQLEIQKRMVQHLHAQLKDFEGEIKRLRNIIDNHNLFMQQIVLELINKPLQKTAGQLYLEKKATETPTAGPKGKLP